MPRMVKGSKVKNSKVKANATGSTATPADAQLFKNWKVGSADGDCPMFPEKVRIKIWSERRTGVAPKTFIGLLNGSETIMVMSAHKYGEERAMYLAESFKEMFLNGWTKDQLKRHRATLKIGRC